MELVHRSTAGTMAGAMHQDKMTGSVIWSEGKPQGAVRLLIDLTGRRIMRWAKKGRDGRWVELHSTKAPMVAMTKAAAGFGSVGPIFHGRFGVGTSISVDLTPGNMRGSKKGDKKVGTRPGEKPHKLYNFFVRR